jgi:hypothetical protein
MRYEVNKKVMGLIDLGNEVITMVRELLPHGAGNQKFNQTKTRGWGTYLTDTAQAVADTAHNWSRPGRVAGAFIKFGAGNCQDQAAVTYLLLREWLSARQEASFCLAGSTHHAFAAIGVPNTDPNDQVVIVDPWPEMAQAVLWKHHFCRKDGAFQVLRHKPGGRADKISKAVARYERISFKKDEDYPAYDWATRDEGTWNHRWCSTNAEQIDYFTVGIKDKVAEKFKKFFHLR